MAKLFVIEQDSGEKNPFLRGVLVESLVRAGLSFQDAYLVAQTVRENLGDVHEIPSSALKSKVFDVVKTRFGPAPAKAYELGTQRERQIMVQTPTDESPFSVGILSRSLQACAISRTDALETAKLVSDSLQQGDTDVIDHIALRTIVYRQMQIQCSNAAADRYLSWRQFKESGIPLIVLVGGITGTGKSTLTTELAYQLNVIRTQSTDMMREIIRCYLPPADIPSLSFSSFEAWRGLTDENTKSDSSTPKVIRGFLSQFAAVKDGLEATIHRAIKENHDLIIDGVHVLPWKLDLDIKQDQAIVVSLMMVVPNKKTLSKRLDQIWELQNFLVAEAEERKIPLILNVQIEEALEEILLHINHAIMSHFPAKH